MIYDVISEYCARMILDMPKIYKFERLLTVSNLNYKLRKGSWPVHLSKIHANKTDKFAIMKRGSSDLDNKRLFAKVGNLNFALEKLEQV